jgi:hypothetical protein
MAYPFTLEPGYAGFRFNEWFRIWIDLDQDGTFQLENELVYDTQGRSNDAVNDDLTVPVTATIGPTRMRVVMQYNDAPEGPCVPNYDYGETEDYCVNLVVGPTAVGHDPTIAETSIYPQPADQQLFVRLPDHLHHEGMLLVVLDAAGRTISTNPLSQQRNMVPTADLTNGLYTFVLLNKGERAGQGRFMVLHAQ